MLLIKIWQRYFRNLHDYLLECSPSPLIIFSYRCMIKKVLFQSQIFEIEILIDLHVLRSPKSESHIFSKWSVCKCVCLGVCVCVCLCVCYQYNSKTNYSRNIKFGIQHLYHIQMLLETFYNDRTKTLCTGAHKRILLQ